MSAYKLDSDDAFICAADTETVLVYQLDPPESGAIKETHWIRVAIISSQVASDLKRQTTAAPAADQEDEDDFGDLHDGLQIQDVEFKGNRLKELAEHLYFSRLLVNREGFCFLDTLGITDSSYGADYFRMNDVFNWSKYDDKLKPNIGKLQNKWRRSCIDNGEEIIPEDRKDDYSKNETDHQHSSKLEKELEKTKAELNQAREKLSSTEEKLKIVEIKVAELQQELIKYKTDVPEMSETDYDDDEEEEDTTMNIGGIIETRRFVLPSEAFTISSSTLNFLPQLKDDSGKAITREFRPVNVDVDGKFPKEAVTVYTSCGHFDKDNWWIVRAKENDKRRCVVAVYDGFKDQIQHGSNATVHVPFHRQDANTFSSNSEFFVVNLGGYGTYFAFTYQA